MGVFKKQAEQKSLDIGELVRMAAAQAPQAVRPLAHMEHASHFGVENVARSVAIWARYNVQALRYCGDSVEKIKQEVAALDARIKTHREEAAKCKIEITRQAGGFEGMHYAASVGMEPQYDTQLLARQRQEEAAAASVRQERETTYKRYIAAQAHEKAKAEAAQIVGALLGVLNG